jgi:poly(3-hydroxybutyrate) depolymerase
MLSSREFKAASRTTAYFNYWAEGQQIADLHGVPLQIFTYRPSGCLLSGALLVFHGFERNAEAYRDDAIPLARRFCMLVVAPLFDEARFPTWRYQRSRRRTQRGGNLYVGSNV